MSTNYSIWPVVLVPYNLPPWLCMKQPNFILSMIIPGSHTVGNNIDVYLQPLIKELNELWGAGVDTFDSSKDEIFKMRAALMWTVSDFPGLDILSGWNTHTGLASIRPSSQPSRSVHSASHPAPMDQATSQLDPAVYPASLLSRSVSFTSRLSPIDQDSSQSSWSVHSTSHSTPTNQGSSQPAPTVQATPKKPPGRESTTHWVV